MENKCLRNGITTGTCAAAAACASARLLLAGQENISEIGIITPKGTEVHLPLFHMVRGAVTCSCAVQKDAGDDPDITDGVFIYASVSRLISGKAGLREEEEKRSYEISMPETGRKPLYVNGGSGIGTVTKKGLSCPVGKPAINPVPRRMIAEAVDMVRQETDYGESLLVCIWLPEGIALAEKTFNPKLGIVGGLSVLGTTGIVEPMSEKALTETIRLEIHMRAVEGKHRLFIIPGNYGGRFLEKELGINPKTAVQCSNFVWDAMRMAREEGMKEILFTGHIGKLIKVAGGVKNTHSRYGDRRMEILWDCAEQVPAACVPELKKRILSSNTTEEAIGVLKENGLLKAVMEEASRRIISVIEEWLLEEETESVRIECVLFSLDEGILAMSPGAADMISEEINQKRTGDF